ncbi:MAG: hypothetical protein H6736_16600 [Alphaproteobacteria bacterium]|nr:hypothetical protein [Alphaproteobacteria bacterium]MCB9693435.1 hypothetical protein [Alphaproteobacteria bacterium]
MFLLTLGALATEPPTCPPAEALLPAERWLRAVSLDLRGVIPDPADYQRITEPDALPADLVDEWLASDAFLERAVRHHRSLLWPGFTDTRFVINHHRINVSGGIWRSSTRDRLYRGAAGRTCGDFEATFDAEGRPVPNAQGREGWVRVHPYWEADPTVTIRMCAYDAQDTVVSSNGTVCADQNGRNDPNCGCGPDLAYCVSPDFVTDLRASLAGTLDARVKAVLTADAPYSELLTADRMYVNGPLVHYFRNQSKVPASVRLDLAPLDIAALPDLDPWEVDHWVEVPVHAGHSGALTDPAFLTRFMSNRSRVNQFWNAFLCQPFTAPAGGIAGLDVQNPTLDLANRDGCRYCHAIIEPSKAHWGRWTEGGGGWLDPAVYPSFDADCETCSESSLPCDDACRRYYTVDPLSPELDPFVGSLSAYQFLPDAEHHRVDDGPEGLVEENIANGRLPTCVSQKTAGWLLGREPTADDDPLVAAWTDELLASGWDYRTLVRSIVLSEPYRRSR